MRPAIKKSSPSGLAFARNTASPCYLRERIMTKPTAKKARVEIFILAGGLSARMGRDKSRVRVGRKTMLAHVRAAAGQLNVPVRVIRRDAVPRCGPLGGIYTALKRSRANSILLLACDMPFVSPQFLRQMIAKFRQSKPPVKALFAREDQRAGFPCVFDRTAALPVVTRQIAQSEFSLQSLARGLRAKMIRPPRGSSQQLANINTPADLQKADSAVRSVSRKEPMPLVKAHPAQ
jgi:molybdopterin-guanine dinucleotide biosynthesis protein A